MQHAVAVLLYHHLYRYLVRSAIWVPHYVAFVTGLVNPVELENCSNVVLNLSHNAESYKLIDTIEIQ